MRSKSDVENRHVLKYAGYPDVQESSLRMTDNFALRPEYAPFSDECSLDLRSRHRIELVYQFGELAPSRIQNLPREDLGTCPGQ
jgi:hypothetical protein